MSGKQYVNTCLRCGIDFVVDSKSKNNPTNKKKFKKACSNECARLLQAAGIRKRKEEGTLKKRKPTILTKLDRDELIRLYCYEYKFLGEIASELGVKSTTLNRELERLSVPREFYRTCPRCDKTYAVKMRSQVNPNSNKFKKFCSRSCFLSSRGQSDTWIEVEVENFLKEKEINYEKQYEVGRLTLDFYLPDINTVIEVNGDFWHANPQIYGKTKPLHRYHPRAIDKDRRKMARLNELGYEVIVVWENDLATNKEGTLSNLYEEIT